MTILRRTRGASPATPAGTPTTSTHLGVKMMRRVEVVGSPREPHWYVDCTTDHDALRCVSSAKGLGLRADQLRIVERYKSV
jgi:hypothetical protein